MSLHNKINDSNATSASLLVAIRDATQSAEVWEQFVDRYQGMINKWCHAWGLQESDRHDVSQDVLLSLSKAMKDFEYDSSRSFRAWLKTVTRNAISSWKKKHLKPGYGHGDSAMLSRLHSVEAREDLSRRLEAEYDTELRDLAILRVRMRVKPRTWQAFQLTAIDGKSGQDVAEQLEMQVAHVYVAKSEVLKLLNEEIRRLDNES